MFDSIAHNFVPPLRYRAQVIPGSASLHPGRFSRRAYGALAFVASEIFAPAALADAIVQSFEAYGKLSKPWADC